MYLCSGFGAEEIRPDLTFLFSVTSDKNIVVYLCVGFGAEKIGPDPAFLFSVASEKISLCTSVPVSGSKTAVPT